MTKKQDWSTWRVFKCWVLLWTHPEREDASLIAVFSSEEKAYHGAATVIVALLESEPPVALEPDVRKTLIGLLERSKWEEAVDYFHGEGPGHKFEIFERDVDELSEPS